MPPRGPSGSRRPLYSSAAYEALNATVGAVIGESHHSTKPMRAILEEMARHEETAGTLAGVPVNAVDTAKATIGGVLRFRLREASTSAIFAGKRHLEPGHVDAVAESLQNARGIGYLDDEMNWVDYEQLLHNFSTKVRTSSTHFNDAVAADLVRQLQQRTRPPPPGGVHLSEGALAQIFACLWKMLHGDADACETVAKMGVVRLIDRLLLGNGLDVRVPQPLPERPELHQCAAGVLSEVVLQSATQAVDRETLARRPGRRARPAPGADPEAAAGGAGALDLSKEGQWAVDTLFGMLRSALKRSEHGAVWGVVKALQRIAGHPVACQSLFACDFVPMLQKALETYRKADHALPKAALKVTPPKPSVSRHPPAFAGEVPSALERPPVTAKARWLSSSSSAPELTQLGRARTNDLRSSCVLRLQPGPSESATRLPPLKGVTAARTLPAPARTAGESEADYPPMMWLVGDDRVPWETFYRACDRSLILLQISKLLRMMEKADIAAA